MPRTTVDLVIDDPGGDLGIRTWTTTFLLSA
jgi:hypothetical protein